MEVIQVGLASTGTASVDEWDLDTQFSTGKAEKVQKLLIYDTTSLADSDIALMFNKFVEQNLAKAGNASFGECETFAFLDGSMLADDNVFLEAAAQGQTVYSCYRRQRLGLHRKRRSEWCAALRRGGHGGISGLVALCSRGGSHHAGHGRFL